MEGIRLAEDAFLKNARPKGLGRSWLPPSSIIYVHTMTIDAFRGKWTKLGNYSSGVVFYEGHAYQSVEHAYQAQKSTDPGIQKMIRDCATPAVAKKLARSVQLRSDWETVKVPIMLTLLREKFSQEPEQSILLSTGDQILREGNWWHDNYWGNCSCPNCDSLTGLNWLGRLLEQVREEIRSEISVGTQVADEASLLTT